jgi:dTDP-4-dehydrorhamnose 3,5-epimerase
MKESGSKMEFKETAVQGAYLVTPKPFEDDRGYFNRAFCAKEFAAAGLLTHFVQANMAGSVSQGTLRGMHYQVAPHEETKLFRCIRGSVYDVVLDVRAGSKTFGQWAGVELSAANRSMLYVPGGCAHGYLTLEDDTEVYYLVSEYYHPDAERGIRWNDPRFGIEWPVMENLILSDKDKAWADFRI